MTALVWKGHGTAVPALLLSVIGPSGFLILPVLVGAAAADLQMSEAEVGGLASAVMGGMALSSALALLWIRRANWRLATTLALLLIAVGNAGCLLASTPGCVIGWLLMTGVGGGAVYSIALTVLGDEPAAARYFGFSVAAQVTFQVVGMLLLPTLSDQFGLDAVVGALLVINILGFLLVPLLPVRSRENPAVRHRTSSVLPSLASMCALMGCFLFFLNIGVVWTYVERMASGAGFSLEMIGFSLALGVAFGVPGALAASWCGSRFGYWKPLAVGSVMMLLALGMLAGMWAESVFVVMLALYNFSWNFLLSFQYAAVGAVDSNGRSVAIAPAFHGFGAALGPAVAALFVTRDDYSAVVILAVAGVVGSLVLFSFALWRQRQQGDPLAVEAPLVSISKGG